MAAQPLAHALRRASERRHSTVSRPYAPSRRHGPIAPQHDGRTTAMKTDPGDAETDGLPEPRRFWAVLTIALGLMMSVLDGSIANLALPTLARELDVSAASSIWVVNAYQLAVTISLLPLAALGEIVGYRRVYHVGMMLFTAASLACPISDSLPTLTASPILPGFRA